MIDFLTDKRILVDGCPPINIPFCGKQFER